MLLTENWPLVLVLVLLSAAIIGGTFTAFVRFTDKNTVIDTGLLHGRLGLAGLLLLFLLVLMGRELNLSVATAMVMFVFTVMGGVLLYFIIRRKGILPKLLIFFHGMLAVISLAVLVSGLLV